MPKTTVAGGEYITPAIAQLYIMILPYFLNEWQIPTFKGGG